MEKRGDYAVLTAKSKGVNFRVCSWQQVPKTKRRKNFVGSCRMTMLVKPNRKKHCCIDGDDNAQDGLLY